MRPADAAVVLLGRPRLPERAVGTPVTFPPTQQALPDFEALVHRYANHVWRMLRYLGVREADIEDAAQEVFLVVHRRVAELESPAAIRPWITSICVGIASNARRSQRRRREDLTDEIPEGQIADGVESLLERKRAREFLLDILAQLDDDKRTVFVLFEVEDMEMAEIAHMLGCPLKTAYSRLYAARRWVTAQVETRLERSGA